MFAAKDDVSPIGSPLGIRATSQISMFLLSIAQSPLKSPRSPALASRALTRQSIPGKYLFHNNQLVAGKKPPRLQPRWRSQSPFAEIVSATFVAVHCKVPPGPQSRWRPPFLRSRSGTDIPLQQANSPDAPAHEYDVLPGRDSPAPARYPPPRAPTAPAAASAIVAMIEPT